MGKPVCQIERACSYSPHDGPAIESASLQGNVRAITDTTNSGQAQIFGYDARDRLITSTTTTAGSGRYAEGFGYNLMGNPSAGEGQASSRAR
jgi:YD repeat-containing protein